MNKDETIYVAGHRGLYSDDFADAVVFLMKRHRAADLGEFSNVGTGSDLGIAELAAVVGFRGELVHDRTKPDGTPRKLLDVSRMEKLGWKARMPLKDGLERAYRQFCSQHHVPAA